MTLLPFRTFFTVILLVAGFISHGQIGAKISVMNPTGDIGPIFKKAPVYELFYVSDGYENRFRSKIGISYTSPAPRLDTFPDFGYRGGNDRKFLPGGTVYHNFYMLMVHVGADIKILKFNKFYWYAGISMAIGVANTKYYREVKTLLTENVDREDQYGGFIFRSSVEYKLNNHFGAFLEASKSSLINKEWATGYGHYNFGLGINYFIKASE